MNQHNEQDKEIPITFNMKGDLYVLFQRYANGFEMTPEDMLEIMVDQFLRAELQHFNPPPATEPAFARKDMEP